MMSGFTSKVFENDENQFYTHKGHNGSFCINYNGVVISSLKSLSAHNSKVKALALEKNMKDVTPDNYEHNS